jgi:2-oxoglutarate ferredoxin oxidoreductase subunit alpha
LFYYAQESLEYLDQKMSAELNAEKLLMKGNEALAEGAVVAGCRYYFGYPITPQNEIPAYMSRRMPEVGGVFIQSESELSAINMVYGAAAAGVRAMTSSSSPGISLKQEGISYLAGAELPAVIVNVARGGPGLGNISPSQADYFQTTRGGGHGDYRVLALAPASVQEMFDLTVLAFELADKYRNPVLILADGLLGQMLEPLVIKPVSIKAQDKPWALSGAKSRPANCIKSLYLGEGVLEKHNRRLQHKYHTMQHEIRYEGVKLEDARLVVTAFGSVARIAKSAISTARANGLRVGLIRPITLWPFPSEPFAKMAALEAVFLTVEMNTGQMLDDVKLAVNGKSNVHFYGRTGGEIPTPEEILRQIEKRYPKH